MALALSIVILLLLGSLLTIAVLGKRVRTLRRDEIRRTEERRSSFVSIISHQLRTPLSIIKGYLEGLLTGDQGEVTDSQREYLADALKVNKDTITLVNDYLSVVKMDLEHMELHREETDLATFIGNEVKKMGPLARASNCEMSFAAPASLPRASIDPIQIRQVVENILTNAVKYTSGHGRIDVSLVEHDGQIRFACKDNGVGIPKDDQDELFAKFFRAKNILHKDTTGSGLGLYLAKVIIEAHGGTTWIESEEGVGTTVFFTIPKH